MQFKARTIHLHPKFRRIEGKDNQAPKYDLAILLLDRPVLSSSMIIPICLPPPGLHLNKNTSGTVAGWGRIGQTSSSPASSILQAATVPILSRDECVHQHQPGSSMPSVDQLCAGVSGDKKGPCPLSRGFWWSSNGASTGGKWLDTGGGCIPWSPDLWAHPCDIQQCES